ncbi:hypothetical protein HMPREF9538_02943 [Klebsiella sp. MS 92-3]|nr:hypothetical protein HMPREF9538_02943 [Klebsiella sp. MS 92-3]
MLRLIISFIQISFMKSPLSMLGLMSQKLYMKDLGMDTNMYLFQTIVLKLIENIFRVQKEF